MGSAAPAVMNDEGILAPLPPLPRWNIENAPQNPRDMQEDQLVYMTQMLETEVSEHNLTRSKYQRYLGKALAHERALCAEQSTVRYLSCVIHDLRTQVQSETTKRLKAEEEKKALLLQNLEDDFCCEFENCLDQAPDSQESLALDEQDLVGLCEVRKEANAGSSKRKYCHISDITTELEEGTAKRVKN